MLVYGKSEIWGSPTSHTLCKLPEVNKYKPMPYQERRIDQKPPNNPVLYRQNKQGIRSITPVRPLANFKES